MSIDWIGNSKSVFTTLGASNHSLHDREENDYYATDPVALEKLLKKESFNHYVLEPAVGCGHLANVLIDNGYDVKCFDIIDRGYPGTEKKDFLSWEREPDDLIRDIITNPPYSKALQFIEHAIEQSEEGTKIAMLLKIQFLEGKKRRAFFEKSPPKNIYVFSERINCAKNGDFKNLKSGKAVCYAWFIWIKGFQGSPFVDWI